MPQDLLRQCIRVEVGERLSLEAILGHPWLLPNVVDGSKMGHQAPSSGQLGGLPIPSREHGAKGISHPQVKMVTLLHAFTQLYILLVYLMQMR